MALWMLTFTNWGTFGRRAALIVAAVAGPLLFSELLGAPFGKPGVAAGWNAAYMACELATGHEWFECAEIVKSRGINTDDPAAFAMALYTIAREAFTADPSVTWHTLSANVSAFLYHCSLQILGGYLVTPRFPSWVFEYFLIALIPGIAFHIWRASWRDYLFWLLTTVAVLVSAAAIFKHDGWRALTGSHPLIALGLCIGWRDMRGRRLPPTEMPLRTMFAGLSLTAVTQKSTGQSSASSFLPSPPPRRGSSKHPQVHLEPKRLRHGRASSKIASTLATCRPPHAGLQPVCVRP